MVAFSIVVGRVITPGNRAAGSTRTANADTVNGCRKSEPLPVFGDHSPWTGIFGNHCGNGSPQGQTNSEPKTGSIGLSERNDIYQYNRESWNQAAEQRQRWSTPVSREELQRARGGDVQIVLTPQRKVPRDWLGDLSGKEVLLLAGSGGQQAPLIAAAGAKVTVLDISPGQLALDRMVADQEGLTLRTLEGSMDDLSNLESEVFDLIVHPCSNTFVPSVLPVWREAFRVLQPGGELISGFLNPVFFVFDEEALNQGKLHACNRVPYSDIEQMKPEQLSQLQEKNEPLCFGHTLEDQLGGQLRAGFLMVDLYEDKWGPGDYETLDHHLATFLATRCRKPVG